VNASSDGGAAVKCELCGTESDSGAWPRTFDIYWFRCGGCGPYAITSEALQAVRKQPPLSPARLNLISYTYGFRNERKVQILWKLRTEVVDPEANVPPLVRDIEDQGDVPIAHAQKPNDILRLIASKLVTSAPFSEAQVGGAELRALKIADDVELAQWVGVLSSEELIEGPQIHRPMKLETRLTPRGWRRVEELFGRAASTTCFVARSFTHPDGANVQAAIVDACKANGWEAKSVDQHEYTGGIMDRVLAEINQSRFVVADFTDNKGGVYYEAGYAEARGLPVIYTIHKDHLAGAHFDIKHLNMIVWETPGELCTRLEARIGAVINR
jgi:hypothetical protein